MRAAPRCSGRRAEAFPDVDLSPAALGAGATSRSLTDEAEVGIVQLIAQYPRMIEAAAAAHEPHRVAFFLHELASAFHSLLEQGQRFAAITVC